MKKLFSIVFALVVMMTCAGCGGGNEQPAKQDAATSDKIGALMPIGLDEEGYKRWTKSIAEVEGQTAYTAPNTVVFFDNLSSMLAALKAKQIDRFATSKVVADYIVAHNKDLEIINYNLKPVLGYSMAMRESDKATVDEINNAISSMNNDGTLEKLIKREINALNGAEPTATELTKIEGAPTIKVAVTGDMPAMDCILANGTPAGFNVAFLNELGKRINKNFELIDVDAGARAAALASGQVDALFWVVGTYDQDRKALPYPLDSMKDVAISIPYLLDSRVGIKLK